VNWCHNLVARTFIRFVHLKTDIRGRPEILARGMNRRRVAEAANILADGFRREGSRRLVQPAKEISQIVLRIEPTEMFWEGRRLDQQEPPHVLRRKLLISLSGMVDVPIKAARVESLSISRRFMVVVEFCSRTKHLSGPEKPDPQLFAHSGYIAMWKKGRGFFEYAPLEHRKSPSRGSACFGHAKLPKLLEEEDAAVLCDGLACFRQS
jgi:hypothetical protein